MQVFITSAKRGKEKLKQAFIEAGAQVVNQLTPEVKLIIPTVDEELPFFAGSREWFKAKGVDVMVGSENTVFHCRDKMEFHQWCNRHQFQTPRTWQLDGHLKPRFGKGSKGITRITHDYIVQEHCPFPEISIDYFADLDGRLLSIIPRYRLDVINGESQSLAPVLNFDTALIERFGREMELVGHNVIQGYWTGEVFIFGEVNPRFGGGSWLTFEVFNSPKYLVKKYS